MMLGCERLIVADRNLRERRLGVVILNVSSPCTGDERDLGLGEFADLDRLIKKFGHVYHPSRYALASR